MPCDSNNFREIQHNAGRGGTADATDLKRVGSSAVTADPSHNLQEASPTDESASRALFDRRAKQRERMKVYRETHRDEVRAFDRKRKTKYRRKNKAKLSTYAADYYIKNRGELIPAVRQWQDNNRDAVNRHSAAWNKRHPVKAKAHDAVYWALKSGKLTRCPCEVCGETRVHAHHDDYAKPLDVRWLCQAHHPAADAERRKRERAAAPARAAGGKGKA